MAMKKNLPVTLVLVLAVFVISMAGLFYRHHHANHSLTQTAMNLNIDGTVLPTTRKVPPFDFTDNHNQAFTNANLKNHWTLLFFGFTNCGYVCPTTLSTLNTLETNLKAQLPANLLPQVVMVSVDPERDTTHRLNDYIKSFNPDFLAIRADLPKTTALANQMSVVFAKVNMPSGDYTINHSAEIMLLDPSGHLRAFFSYPHKADQMLHDYVAIVHAYPSH